MFVPASLFACTVAALVSISFCAAVLHPLPSQCPELFRYEEIDNQGEWTGNLTLRSEVDLNGVWIRVIFDKEVKELTVDNPLFVVKFGDDDRKLVKLQARDYYLLSGATAYLNIKVIYEGTEVPSLIEYRLNARTICPQNKKRRLDVFEGDCKSEYFLSSLAPTVNPTSPKYECGVAYPSNLHPWQAALYLNVGKEEKYACDGILISPNYVLTVAHCVTFINDTETIPRAFVTVHLNSNGESVGAVRNVVNNIFVHPGYASRTLIDDLAIVELIHPVDVINKFRPICLIGGGSNHNKVTLTGYQIKNDGSVGSLHESELLRRDYQECVKLSPDLKKALTFDSYCFAYNSGEKNCVGVSGSGMIATTPNGQSTLKGLVTLGLGLQQKTSCDENSNIIVIDLERYISWIYNIIL